MSTHRPVGIVLMVMKRRAQEEVVDGDAWAMSCCRLALASIEGVMDDLYAARIVFFGAIGVSDLDGMGKERVIQKISRRGWEFGRVWRRGLEKMKRANEIENLLEVRLKKSPMRIESSYLEDGTSQEIRELSHLTQKVLEPSREVS